MLMGVPDDLVLANTCMANDVIPLARDCFNFYTLIAVHESS